MKVAAKFKPSDQTTARNTLPMPSTFFVKRQAFIIS